MAEVKTRRSKQRDAIYEILMNDHSHPSVDDIFVQARKVFPDISLGTVYRNLNFLAENKMIRRLDIGDNVVHYDGNIEPHFHMVCDECSSIVDIDIDNKMLISLVDSVEDTTQAEIKTIEILFNGRCGNCVNKKEGGH